MFKPGDRVRCIIPPTTTHGKYQDQLGKIYKVISYTPEISGFQAILNLETIGDNWFAYRFEKVRHKNKPDRGEDGA